MRTTIIAVVVAAAALIGRSAQGQALSPQPGDESRRVDLSKLGPQVGERVPDFSLRDQTGHLWDLESIMGPNGAMLVFFRSAGW